MSGLATVVLFAVVALGGSALEGTPRAHMDPWTQRKLDDDVRTILADPGYAFCHDAEYPLLPSEADWCSFAEQAAGRCDGWQASCGAKRGELRGAPGRLSTRRRQEGDGSEDPQAGGQGHRPDRRVARSEPESVTLPSLGGLAEFLFWGILAVTVLVLLRAIISNLSPSRDGDADASAVPVGDLPDADPDVAARRAMETDVERLLAFAREAAARGEFGPAVDFAHAALLRRLDHEGLIHLHRSRTNGDYVRQLRSHPQWSGPVRDVLREVDRAQFGNVAPARASFDSIFDKVRDLVKRAAPLAVWLLIAGALGCDPDLAKSYPWDTSPSGQKAVTELLQRQGYEAGFLTGAVDGVDDTGAVLLMLDEAWIGGQEWDHLRDWVSSGGTLWVASGQTPPWMQTRISTSAVAGPARLHPDAELTFSEPLVYLTPGPTLSGVEAEDAVLLTRGEEPYAIARPMGGGWVVVFADDTLFTNASITMADNASFVVELVGWAGKTRVKFVDGWASAGADNPFESVRRSHLTPAVVQLLLLVLLSFLWRGVRFGRGRDPAPPSRLTFTLHARAMGHHYRKAKALGHAAKLYASWVLERLRDRFPTAARGGLSGLAQAVARRTGRDETEVVRLLVEAHSAGEAPEDGRDEGHRSETKRLIRDLGQLMRELGGTK